MAVIARGKSSLPAVRIFVSGIFAGAAAQSRHWRHRTKKELNGKMAAGGLTNELILPPTVFDRDETRLRSHLTHLLLISSNKPLSPKPILSEAAGGGGRGPSSASPRRLSHASMSPPTPPPSPASPPLPPVLFAISHFLHNFCLNALLLFAFLLFAFPFAGRLSDPLPCYF